ncbi:hypothetical protein [Niallia sp. 03133]|uniref:hypothetical protein n=1 Tax=Niallia sp. 03133 TaxID=3458060 RepID=UPI0040441200
MFILMICLLCFSIFLFLFSFFAKDPYKILQDDLDQLSIQNYQELYKVKKKLKLLEEELLLDEIDMHTPSMQSTTFDSFQNSKDIHAIIKNQVWSLASQGVPINNIAKQSSLSILEVQEILKEMPKKGNNDE